MSFLLDAALVVLLVLIVWMYSKRSVFSATAGVITAVVSTVSAVLLIGVLSAPISEYAVTPLVEQAAANDLADLFSAPHLSGGKETVQGLILGTFVWEQPDAYLQVVQKYGANANEVLAAYQANPATETVLTAITADYIEAISKTLSFFGVVILVWLLCKLIFRRVEQNFPPERRYRGFRRVWPWAIGVGGGVWWSLVAAAVIHWLVPVLTGHMWFMTADVFEKTTWYAFLTQYNPLVLLAELLV